MNSKSHPRRSLTSYATLSRDYMPKEAYGEPKVATRAQADSQRGLRRGSKAGRSPRYSSGPDWLCRNGHED